MLGEGTIVATVAVNDIAKAKDFYGNKLGLKQVDENPGGVTYESNGGSKLFVYPSEFAGTNRATNVTWVVSDLGACVDDLKKKGVEFEHYDNLPETTRDGDIHSAGPWKGAWFTDLDGNILAISSM